MVWSKVLAFQLRLPWYTSARELRSEAILCQIRLRSADACMFRSPCTILAWKTLTTYIKTGAAACLFWFEAFRSVWELWPVYTAQKIMVYSYSLWPVLGHWAVICHKHYLKCYSYHFLLASCSWLWPTSWAVNPPKTTYSVLWLIVLLLRLNVKIHPDFIDICTPKTERFFFNHQDELFDTDASDHTIRINNI